MDKNHSLYVGIDSHSRTHKVALISAATLKHSPKDIEKSELIDVRNNFNDFDNLARTIQKYSLHTENVVIGIDSCGAYTLPITHYLQQRKYQVYFMENKSRKAIRGYLFDLENKNDVIDAIRIAYLLYLKDVGGPLFQVTSLRSPDFDSKASILHTLILHRQQYTKLVTQSTNRLHVFLTAIFPEAQEQYFNKLLKILPNYPTPQEIRRSRGMKKIKGIGKTTKNEIKVLAKNTVGIPADNFRELILNLCLQRKQAISWQNKITESIQKEVNNHPYGVILLSFPGVGILTAATLIGMIGDIKRWSSDKKLKKAMGLYSTSQQSGNSPIIRKQGKSGSRLSKAMLYQVILRCIQNKASENDFRDYYRYKVSKGKPKMSAIVATMGKLTEIMYHCLQTDELYRYKGTYKKSRNRIKKIGDPT